MKRATSLLLTLVLALTLAPDTALAASAAYGSDVWLQDTVLQDGVVLSDNIFWSGNYSQPRHEYYITYSPSGGTYIPSMDGSWDHEAGGEDIPGWLLARDDEEEAENQPEEETSFPFEEQELSPHTGGTQVRPVVVYGSSVCDRLTSSAAAQYYEQNGYRVVGAINGDFYDTSTGFPLGLLVSRGTLLSGSANYYAVGFRSDGSVVMGAPKLSITARSAAGQLALAAVNKPRVEQGGATLLTYYYRNDHTTGISTAGVNVLCTVTGGKTAIGGELVLQVAEVTEDKLSRTLEPNQVLLTAALTGQEAAVSFLRALTPGETVTVSFTAADEQWNEVTEAVGGYYLLVDNGVAQTGFEAGGAPRTAVGLKANGDLILYTIDGRQNGHSMGASLEVVAQRLVELGCVTALGMDGGGSTTAVAALPDSGSAKLLNSPSDKSQRKVTNHILLLAPGESTGVPGGVYLTADAPAVMTGHTVELAANLTDTNYFPMRGSVQLDASGGTVAGTTFTAPEESGPVTITASASGFSARREVLVVDGPDQLSIQRGGSAITSLTLTPGATAELGVSASYNHLPLEIFSTEVEWSVDPELGSIDENGVLTVGLNEGKGTITASRGGVTAKVALTVEADLPFVDLEGHWGAQYIANLFYRGIFAGVTVDGELYAYPDNGVTRAEFSVLLARYLELDTSEYANVQIPFTDLTGVESWAGGAIRAMYALGIVNGVDATHFAPQGGITRAQAVTMLGRALAIAEGSGSGTEVPDPSGEPNEPELPDESTAPDVPDGTGAPDASDVPDVPLDPVDPNQPEEQGTDLSQFTDVDQVPPYAYEHFQTLVGLGAVEGTDGQLRPDEAMTRAAVCKMLASLPQ